MGVFDRPTPCPSRGVGFLHLRFALPFPWYAAGVVRRGCLAGLSSTVGVFWWNALQRSFPPEVFSCWACVRVWFGILESLKTENGFASVQERTALSFLCLPFSGYGKSRFSFWLGSVPRYASRHGHQRIMQVEPGIWAGGVIRAAYLIGVVADMVG